MSPAVISGFALFLIGAALFLAQLWAQPWSPETFLKLMATDGCAAGDRCRGRFCAARAARDGAVAEA